MKEQKNLSYSLRKVAHPFISSLNSMFLPILRPPTVPRSHFSHPKTKVFKLITNYLYLQIVPSASESRFCVGK